MKRERERERELAIGQMRCNLHLDYEIGFRLGSVVKIFIIVLLQRSPWYDRSSRRTLGFEQEEQKSFGRNSRFSHFRKKGEKKIEFCCFMRYSRIWSMIFWYSAERKIRFFSILFTKNEFNQLCTKIISVCCISYCIMFILFW